MAQTITVSPKKSYGPGTWTFPARTIPTGISKILLTIDMSKFTDSTMYCWVAFDISVDGGITWIGNSNPHDCYAAAGRPGHADSGTQPPLKEMRLAISVPDAPDRMIRGAANITGGSVQTSITVTII